MYQYLIKLTRLFQRMIQPLNREEKDKVGGEIFQSAVICFDFLLLVVLSCSIATLGLLTNSPAVIIGAMLVAPLMSPIIGIGLASITGNGNLARNSAASLFSSVALAIFLSWLMTEFNSILPFIMLQDIPDEILARSHPSPIDLGIALAGGLAAAYALTRPNISAALPGVAIATALMPPLCTIGIGIALDRRDIAGGALLLYLTNAITIAFAAALVFFMRGYTPQARFNRNQFPRTLIISAFITLIMLIPLTYYGINFFRQANDNRLINEVVRSQVEMMEAELVEFSARSSTDNLELIITLRTNSPLAYEKVTSLQKGIVDGLRKPVSLKVNQILAERLDPLIPPTLTPTPTVTATQTPGPSPSPSLTPLPPTATFTLTVTATATASATPTPVLVQAFYLTLPQLQLYQSPGGPVIGHISFQQKLTLLYGQTDYDGLVWVEVMDKDGRVGWIPQVYVRTITATPDR